MSASTMQEPKNMELNSSNQVKNPRIQESKNSDQEQAEFFFGLLIASGFSVEPDGDVLFVRPREKLTEADCELVRRLKSQLMELAAWHACDTCESMVDRRCKQDISRLCNLTKCPMRGA